MILSPLLGIHLRPAVYSWIKQSRHIRPSVKIGKEKFQLTIDVHQFTKDEIRVKARPEYVIIEGKQERKTKRGYVLRQFVRKFKLPQGCSPKSMESKLSPDGILTITAPRKACDSNLPCETVIPISYMEPIKDKEESIIPVKDKNKDPCSAYLDKSSEKKPK